MQQLLGSRPSSPLSWGAFRTKLNPDPAGITETSGDISRLLDVSITGLDMPAKPAPVMHLSKVDFEALRSRFKESKHVNTDLEVLKASIRAVLERLISLNQNQMMNMSIQLLETRR
jgi:type I restriction enzyme, R subunit